MNRHELTFPKGKISFGLPDPWVFEAEQPDMFMYYDPRKGSGTLRVHVVTAKGSLVHKATPENFEKDYRKLAGAESGKFHKIDNDKLLFSYLKKSEEQGRKIIVYFWQLGKLSSPFIFNFVFSFTILEDQQRDKKIISEIEMLEKSIYSAVITLK